MCCLDVQVIREANCLTDHCMVKGKAIESGYRNIKRTTIQPTSLLHLEV